MHLPKGKLNNSPLEKRLERKQLNSFRLILLSVLVFCITYAVCYPLVLHFSVVGSADSITVFQQIMMTQAPIFVISLGMALFSVAILVHLRTRLISRQVDTLCRQFLAYRREYEQGELEIPSTAKVPLEASQGALGTSQGASSDLP